MLALGSPPGLLVRGEFWKPLQNEDNPSEQEQEKDEDERTAKHGMEVRDFYRSVLKYP